MSAPDYKKISEVTTQDLANYLRITELDNSQEALLTTMQAAAVNFIIGVTGLVKEALDDYPDLTIVLYALVQDMYDNRTYYVDKANISDTVNTILNMYRTNLL